MVNIETLAVQLEAHTKRLEEKIDLQQKHFDQSFAFLTDKLSERVKYTDKEQERVDQRLEELEKKSKTYDKMVYYIVALVTLISLFVEPIVAKMFG